MKTALVILAAGIGSRFGGVKQLEPVGPNGELIIDYSIHDAICAGFNKIVFIIRHDIEADFRAVIGDRIQAMCEKLGVEVVYTYQEKTDLPEGVSFTGERKKPWGTGHALLTCKDVVQEPFVVINSDDYYGKEAFAKIYEFLKNVREKTPMPMCMAGFRLGNTLSENGGVTRGMCQVSSQGLLEKVTETRNLMPYGDGACVRQPDGQMTEYSGDTSVSMNMWGMTPQVFPALQKDFVRFFQENQADLSAAEFLIPVFVDRLLRENAATVQVLPTLDRWFGVTYREDMPTVRKAFQELTDAGVYGKELFGDLQ